MLNIMKFEEYKFLIIFVILVLFYIAFNNKTVEGATNVNGESAADACRQISSRAEEIKAQMSGTADIITSAMGWLNPRNMGAGNNQADNKLRQIINTDLSQEEKLQIENTCKNVFTGMQSNVIDTSNCKFCQENGCDIQNITQENTMDAEQNCVLQTATEMLMKKQNDIESQAVAKVLQDSQGLFSGSNRSANDICNVTNTDMSSKQYLEQLSNCANEVSQDQSNSLQGCGNVINVVQRNRANRLQDCILNNTTTSSTDIASQNKTSTTADTTQKSKGLDPLISLASIGVVIFLSAGAGIAYYFYSKKGQSNKK